ncbi:MAG: glycosyltransferase family 2 protein [Planctomycetota bacterium]
MGAADGAAAHGGGVSAVVCNFQGEPYLAECLESVLAQPEVEEVIVVDDASTDGSVALVRARFPRVEVAVLGTNRGPCAARNEGLRRARNRWILFVDNDAVLRPGAVGLLLAVLRARPGCAAAQPRSLLHDDPGRVHYDAGAFHYAGLLSLRNFYVPLAAAAGEGVVPTDAMIAIAPLVDREALLAVGGWDEAFFYLAEDFDLSLRLRQAGHEIVAVEEAIVLHKGGTAGLSFRGGSYPRRRAYLHARNRWLLIGKNYAARTILAALPGILVYEAAWLLFALFQGHLGADLAGKAAFLRALPSLRRARREVQARRRAPDRALLVGGPLTLSPSLLAKPAARRAAAVLDAILRGWWVIGKRISG